MSCHPNHDQWKLASPEDSPRLCRDIELLEEQLAQADFVARVTKCEQAVHAACVDWPGEWTWRRPNGKVEPEVSLTLYDHDKSRFWVCMDGAEFSSLEDLHQSLLLFADVVSQHMR